VGKIPILGLGTWKAAPGEVTEAVKVAIDAGYRHFDCAYLYNNENDVGTGIQQKIKEGVVRREDLFIVSKLWCTYHKKALVKTACYKSLKALKLDYLDLYLIHWPMGFKPGEKDLPLDRNGMVIPSETDYLETWEAMEDLVIAGLVKYIGVSNFNHEQLERLLDKPDLRIKPITNQIECHPYLTQRNLIRFCQSRDVSVTAYRPLGGSCNTLRLIVDIRLAEKSGKTAPCQRMVTLLWDRVLYTMFPKFHNLSLGQANTLQVFDFELAEQEVDELLCLDRDFRMARFPIAENHKDYPFNIEY
uniref:Aldo-keto reductase family 1 member E2 n=1 Tax=Loxodonta africana TaxID=9785 RepID=G3UEI0_LOXAF